MTRATSTRELTSSLRKVFRIAFASPLRGSPVRASCDFGTHHIWWEVEAPSERAALDQLPR
jgi:hypothetical protein